MSSQMYDVSTCPKCGCLMYNGRCENRECTYHWHPYDECEEKEGGDI